MQWGYLQPRSGEGDEAMRWGHLPLAGESGAHELRAQDRSGRRIRGVADGLPAERLLRALSRIPMGHRTSSGSPMCGIRGGLAAADLVARARWAITRLGR